jgi:hypothetical protein
MCNKIVTYTGKVFDLLNPKPEVVCIKDIAHSLAYQCRYTGHTKFFYSVAQHCVLMAENSDLPGDPLQMLLHDAAEAYIGDMARPWKNLLIVNVSENIHQFPISVKSFEDKIQKVIGLALGVDLNHSAEVREADLRMMATEIRDLMPEMPSSFEWGVDISNPVKEVIDCWKPELAEKVFLNMYIWLTEG